MITAIDVESFLVTPGREAPPLVCVSWSRGTEHGLLDHKDGVEFVRDLLRGNGLVVNLNIAYDLVVLAAEDDSLLSLIFEAYAAGRIRDVGLRQKLIDLADGSMKFDRDVDDDGEEKFTKRAYSLAARVERYTRRKMGGKGGDAWRMRYGTLRGSPIDDWPEEAREYAITDADEAFGLYLAQNNALVKDKSSLIASGTICNEVEQAQAAFALRLMTVWGLRTDPERVAAFRRGLIATQDSLRGELITSGLIRPTGTKNDKMIRSMVEAVFEGQSVERTASGKVKASQDIIKQSGHPLLLKYVKYKQAEKDLSTYVPTLEIGTRMPITPGYNPLVETGRTSSYGESQVTIKKRGFRGSGCNIQNFKRGGDARKCFVPRPGFVYIDADYSLLEFRALGQVMLDLLGYSTIAEALQADKDPHLMVGAQIGGVTYDEALALFNAGDETIIDHRQLAKPVNYGLPGGMSPPTFQKFAASQDVFITLDKAKELYNTFFDTWPDVREYFRWIKGALGPAGEGPIQQLRSKRTRYITRFTQAANGYFQSLAAEGAKEACFRVARECYAVKESPLYGSRPVAFCHDELLVESLEDRAPEAADRLSRVMVESMEKFLPDVPVIAEPVVMRSWFKGAKTIRDKDGRLMVWQPQKKKEKAA